MVLLKDLEMIGSRRPCWHSRAQRLWQEGMRAVPLDTADVDNPTKMTRRISGIKSFLSHRPWHDSSFTTISVK